METKEVEHLKGQVSCAAVLEKAGFAIDAKESTRRAVKHRRGDDIIIVIHDGRGWFDPQSDAKGDVFSLIRRLDSVSFGEALGRAADLIGFVPTEPAWTRRQRERDPDISILQRWQNRRKPWPGSATWRYLRDERCLPEIILRNAIAQDRLREGPHGSMWAAHVDASGIVTGWEERGPEWRGFSTGGAKVLFQLGSAEGPRICVTEAAIDAMSLAAFEGLRRGSLYLSTGGGWSPTTEAALRHLAARPGIQLVAATDANVQGEAFAGRIRAVAEEADCDWVRLTPPAEDWNEAVKGKTREEKAQKERERGVPHARQPRQG